MKNIFFFILGCILFLGCSRNYKSEIICQNKLPGIDKLSFVHQDTGFCIGLYQRRDADNYGPFGRQICAGMSFYKGYLLFTTNGGKDWTALKTPLYTVNSYAFINHMNGWISGGWDNTDGECHAALYRTPDGGTTWESIGDFLANDLYFLDDKNGFAIGNNSLILKTIDGGKTWSQKTIKETNFNTGTGPAKLTKISFKDKNFGMIAGDNLTLLVTEDGGETWEQMIDKRSQSFGLFAGDFRSFAIASEKNIWAILGNNELFHYDGSSWRLFLEKDLIDMGLLRNCRQDQSGYFSNFNGISFSDNKNGWLFGTEGHIFYTENGGKKWKCFPLKMNENKDIDFCRDEIAQSMNYSQLFLFKDNSGFLLGYGKQVNSTLIRIR